MKVTQIRLSTLREEQQMIMLGFKANPKEGNTASISPPPKWINLTTVGSLGASEGKSKDLDALTQLCLCRLRLGTEVLLLSQGRGGKRFLHSSAAEQRAAAAMCLAEAHTALPSRSTEPFPCAPCS